MKSKHSPAPDAVTLSAALAALWIAVEARAESIGGEATALVNLPEMTEARKLTLLAPESTPSPSGDVLGALEACRVFISPLERLKGWSEYKEDAARRLLAALANAGNGAPGSVDLGNGLSFPRGFHVLDTYPADLLNETPPRREDVAEIQDGKTAFCSATPTPSMRSASATRSTVRPPPVGTEIPFIGCPSLRNAGAGVRVMGLTRAGECVS